jgi:hypothetical protein
MKTTDIGFAFDLVCALVYIISIPMLLLFIFGPAISKGIQQMQDQRDGIQKRTHKTNRLGTLFAKIPSRKNKCPRCEFTNKSREEYCIQCGTRLHL